MSIACRAARARTDFLSLAPCCMPCIRCQSQTDLDSVPVGKLLRHPLLMRRTAMRRMQDLGRQTVLGTGKRDGCGQAEVHAVTGVQGGEKKERKHEHVDGVSWSTVWDALLGKMIRMYGFLHGPLWLHRLLTVGINDYFMVEEQLSMTLFCFGILFQVGWDQPLRVIVCPS